MTCRNCGCEDIPMFGGVCPNCGSIDYSIPKTEKMNEDAFLNITRWLAAQCRMPIGCFYKKNNIGKHCPLKAHCCDVEPKDWEKALMKYGPCSVPVPPLKKEKGSLITPKRVMFCKLVDKHKREICKGLLISNNPEQDLDDFIFFERQCILDLVKSFRKVLAEKVPDCANKTDEEVKGIIDSMIAIEGYDIIWGYCGWEGK